MIVLSVLIQSLCDALLALTRCAINCFRSRKCGALPISHAEMVWL